jgi:hypothetical protein
MSIHVLQQMFPHLPCALLQAAVADILTESGPGTGRPAGSTLNEQEDGSEGGFLRTVVYIQDFMQLCGKLSQSETIAAIAAQIDKLQKVFRHICLCRSVPKFLIQAAQLSSSWQAVSEAICLCGLGM